MDPQPTIDELVIADEPEAWRALGFAVEGDTTAVGDVRLRFEGRGAHRGIVRWYVRGARSLELDGLETHASERPPVDGPSPTAGGLPTVRQLARINRGRALRFRRISPSMQRG